MSFDFFFILPKISNKIPIRFIYTFLWHFKFWILIQCVAIFSAPPSFRPVRLMPAYYPCLNLHFPRIRPAIRRDVQNTHIFIKYTCTLSAINIGLANLRLLSRPISLASQSRLLYNFQARSDLNGPICPSVRKSAGTWALFLPTNFRGGGINLEYSSHEIQKS